MIWMDTLKPVSLLVAATLCCSHAFSISNEGRGLHKKREISLPDINTLNEDTTLPRYVNPVSYYLHLQPFLNDGYYNGRVKIEVICETASDTIVLHAHDELHITKADITVIKPNSISERHWNVLDSIAILKTRKDTSKQWFTLFLSNEMQKNAMYQLTFEFTSGLDSNDTVRGFYKQNYSDWETEQSRSFFGVNLKGNNARRAFPCFDDLEYKAKFKISVVRPSSMFAISTMPIRTTEKMLGLDGWEKDTFYESPPMSTYSVSLFIFESTNLYSINPIYEPNMSIYGFAQPHSLPIMQRLAEKLSQQTEYLQQYFGGGFPLPEIKLVSVPELPVEVYDGFGMIVVREQVLLEKDDFQIIFDLIPFQWFGHMLTPNSWLDVEINNGLCYYVNYLMSGNFTGYQIPWGRYLRNDLTDIINDSQLIDDPNVITERWAWIFRMLSYSINNKTLQNGLSRFIYDRAFKTFTSTDLLQALSKQAWSENSLPELISVEEIANSWIENNRYPVVTVTRNYGKNTAQIKQEVFAQEAFKRYRYLWWIPISYISTENMVASQYKGVNWMKGQRELTLRGLPDEDEFILVNPYDEGMFLVNYDTTNWRIIAKYLKKYDEFTNKPIIPEETRAKLLRDIWILSYAGMTGFTSALDLSVFLKNETSSYVWETFFKVLEPLQKLMLKSQASNKFRLFLKDLIEPLYMLLNDNDDYPPGLYTKAQNTMCSIGYMICIDQLRADISNCKDLEDDFNGWSFEMLARWGTIEDWDNGFKKLLNLMTNKSNADTDECFTVDTLVNGLVSYTGESGPLEKILDLLILDENITFPDETITESFNHINDHTTFISYVSKKWTELKERFDNTPEVFMNMLEMATSQFVSPEGYYLVKDLYNSHTDESLQLLTIMDNALDKIIKNSRWFVNNLDDLVNWLNVYLADIDY